MRKVKDIYLRKNTAEQYRKMRDILRNTIPEPKDPPPKRFSWWKVLAIVAVLGAILYLLSGCAWANDKILVKSDNIAGYSVNQWADAIYKAEGGEKTRYPYGILAKYKHTTPRQACINTISSKYKAYKKLGLKTPFIAFLASKYAPIGAKNDPTGLNRNWIKNVNHYLTKG